MKYKGPCYNCRNEKHNHIESIAMERLGRLIFKCVECGAETMVSMDSGDIYDKEVLNEISVQAVTTRAYG